VRDARGLGVVTELGVLLSSPAVGVEENKRRRQATRRTDWSYKPREGPVRASSTVNVGSKGSVGPQALPISIELGALLGAALGLAVGTLLGAALGTVEGSTVEFPSGLGNW